MIKPRQTSLGIARRLNGEREGAGPGGDLGLEGLDLLNLARGDLGLKVLLLVGLLGELALDFLGELDAAVNVVGDLGEVLLTKTTAGHGGSANADTHGGKSALVARGGVLVAGNVDVLEDELDTGTVQGGVLDGLEVEEDHVVVGAVGNEAVSLLLEAVLELLGVLDDLLLVGDEVGALGLLEGNGERGDGVVVGTTLVAREDGEVDGALKVVESLDLLALLDLGLADALAEEDHGATGTAEGLVGGGGDNVGELEGRLVDAGGDQTGNVSHVDHEVAANSVGDLAHAGVVNLAAVGRGTGNKDLGAVHEGVLLELVVVDDASLEVDAVREGLEVGGDSRDLLGGSLVAVGQVATVGQVETHDALVRPHDGLVDLEVGRRARKALHVDAPLLGVELEGLKGAALASELDAVDVLVAAVVAGTGVSLAVLVAHGATQGVEDGARGDVLRGNEEDGLALALDLVLHDVGNLGVGLDERLLHEVLVGLGERVGRHGCGMYV